MKLFFTGTQLHGAWSNLQMSASKSSNTILYMRTKTMKHG